MLTALQRLFVNSDDGILAKVRQHRGTYKPTCMNLAPTIRIDGTKGILKYRGSIGAIYLICRSNIAVKVVPESTRANMEADLIGLAWSGRIASLFYEKGQSIMDELHKHFERELDMARELEMCNLLRGLPLEELGVTTLEPVPRLCTMNRFAYIHDSGLPLTQCPPEYRSAVCRRIALLFFRSLHEWGVLFGDMNPENFLWRATDDVITVIDYGCVSVLGGRARRHLRKLHQCLANPTSLNSLIKKWGGTLELASFVQSQSEPFFRREKTAFAQLPTLTACMTHGILKSDLPPPEIAMALRAIAQLLGLLRDLDAVFTIRDELLKMGMQGKADVYDRPL